MNNIPLVPKLRHPLLRRHVVGFPTSTCDFAPTFNGFVRVAIFLHALAIVCVFPSICTTFEILVWCVSAMMLCGSIFLASSTVPCQTSCPDLPLQSANAHHRLHRCFLSTFLCFLPNKSCRCAGGPSLCTAPFANFALRRLVDDYELGDVTLSLLTVQLHCACIHIRTFVFDIDAVLQQSLFCEGVVKWNQHKC